jgi:hypothetical protein
MSAIVLELISNLFSWGCVGAGFAFIYYAGKAVFYGGPWSTAGVCFVVAGICKWLWRGFRDNANRVVYEKKLIDAGMTPQEARQAWFEAYNK